jgi:hypothetical protein
VRVPADLLLEVDRELVQLAHLRRVRRMCVFLFVRSMCVCVFRGALPINMLASSIQAL